MRRQPIVLVLLAACETGLSPDNERLENTGQFCLSADGVNFDGPQTFNIDRLVHVRFVAAECLSSSCTANPSAVCTVNQEPLAQAIQVDGFASWRDTSIEEGACTPDCLQVAATCASRALASGSFVFEFNEHTIDLSIPSASSGPLCIEN